MPLKPMLFLLFQGAAPSSPPSLHEFASPLLSQPAEAGGSPALRYVLCSCIVQRAGLLHERLLHLRYSCPLITLDTTEQHKEDQEALERCLPPILQ